MITSKIQAINMALAAVGTRSSIADLSEGSTEANTAAIFYDTALDATLRAAHWNFARAQGGLTLLLDGTKTPTPDVVPTPWIYEYAYPNDSVMVRYIMPQFTTSPADASVAYGAQPISSGPTARFVVSSDRDANQNDRTVILTNQPTAVAVYTRRITNVSLWDPQFVTAFSNYLAALMAPQLTGDKQKQQMAFELAHNTTVAARASNGNESVTVNEITPDWMRVRGYANDYAVPPGLQFVQGPQDLVLVT